MPPEKVLVIDDEKVIRNCLARALEDAGHEVILAENGEKGLECLKALPEVIISDLKLPDIDGLSLLKKIHDIDKDLPVILLTAHGTIQSAIEATRLGAFHYLTKPFDLQELLWNVQKAIETRCLKNEVSWLRHEAQKQLDYEELKGNTPKMRTLSAMVEKVALSDAPTIMLEGESGTGKNFVARLIHFKSRQSNYPFMDINCASLPETLIESELFGHERGSFTDAKQMKKGLFEVARGGTVFLDEIAEMSVSTQAKLLQAIDSRKFRRVGGIQDIETNVRIIAATNMNLREAVAGKRFREDLYFRLQLIPIHIPTLRERIDDIPALVDHFIKKFNRDYRKNILGLTPEAEIILKTYHWPGNVRELKNVIERVAILESDSYIREDHLPPEVKAGPNEAAADYVIPEQGFDLEIVEKNFILQALKKTTGNQSLAARLLGISRHTLRYRMEKFGLAKPSHDSGGDTALHPETPI